uniref:Uncharacterized protein n=1 Tax=Rhizophora mucronata TaxID=61149 RepID=A0A2P2KSW3_RHIMU
MRCSCLFCVRFGVILSFAVFWLLGLLRLVSISLILRSSCHIGLAYFCLQFYVTVAIILNFGQQFDGLAMLRL